MTSLSEARERRSRLTTGTAGSASGSHGSCLTTNNKTQAERTTAMLVVIVAVFLITELPQGNMRYIISAQCDI